MLALNWFTPEILVQKTDCWNVVGTENMRTPCRGRDGSFGLTLKDIYLKVDNES